MQSHAILKMLKMLQCSDKLYREQYNTKLSFRIKIMYLTPNFEERTTCFEWKTKLFHPTGNLVTLVFTVTNC